ncbi:hypothetical protein EDD86DRAFT_216488 [Gorgonomyces haynaldii]|nr:hypothetical protein EDD86DRAFT_216488 [Gorgonomyces haynaldii]
MAIGMAVDMKLNTWKPRFDQESHYAACIAINIWWLVYIEDRWTSVLMGVKPLIDDSQCYIPLPIDAQKFSLEFYNIKSEYELLEMGVMASSSLFVPIPDPERQSKALYTTLLKTFSNVSKYSKEFSKVHGAVTGDLLCQEATLASSLLEWFSKCPRQCPEKFTYQCSFSMLTYFTAWITLYSGRIVSHMGRNVVEAYSSKEFKVVVDSAQNITQIVYAIVSENPTFTGLPRYVCHCIYVSGIIHALLLKIQPDAQTVALAQTNFNTNLVALQKMSVFSLPCMLYYKLLLQQQQQLLSLQQPLPPDFADILALPDTPDSFTRSSNSEGETQGPFEISPKLDFENVVNGL